jgi:CBS domain-containing protein
MTHPDTPVAELMTPQPVALAPGDTLEQARFLLERYPFRHLPVVDLTELVGMVSDRDLLLARSLPVSRPTSTGAKEPVRVHELMSTPVHTVEPATRARTAVRTLLDEHIGALPVVTSPGRLVGIVTTSDFLRALQRCACWPGSEPPGAADARACMTAPVLTTTPEEDLDQAAERLLESSVRHLPVVRGAELVGMLSDRDVRRGLARLAREDRLAQAARNCAVPRARVAEVMSEPCLSVAPETQVHALVHTLLEARISALPVVEDGKLVGIVTDTDLLTRYAEAAQFAG